jgi:putative membrane protein
MNRARKPAAFRLDDPGIVVTPSDEPRRIMPVGQNAQTGETDQLPVAPPPPGRRAPWAVMFWLSSAGLLLLATGLGIANLIEDLLNRAAWLGGVGAALVAVAGVALVAVVTREALGLARLATIDTMRERAAAILVSDDRAAGRALSRDLIALDRACRASPGHARGPKAISAIHIDGGDPRSPSERRADAPPDEEARLSAAAAAKRVSMVTAVSPRAAVDDALRVGDGTRPRGAGLALLYGGRPGTPGLSRCCAIQCPHRRDRRHGGERQPDPAGDRLDWRLLSARLGEGVLNGLLTARLGLAAIEATRPLPFVALRQPALNDLAGSLLRGGENRGTEEALQDKKSP